MTKRKKTNINMIQKIGYKWYFLKKNVENYDDYTADDFLNEEEVKKIFDPVVVGEEHDTIMVLRGKIVYVSLFF